jgi:hypothetical protein
VLGCAAVRGHFIFSFLFFSNVSRKGRCDISATKKAYPAVSPSIRLAKYRINTIGLPVAVSMMMMIMIKFYHCGAKIGVF